MEMPSQEKIEQFYIWLREQMEVSRQHYTPGGQKVASCFWMPISVCRRLEQTLKDMEMWTEFYEQKPKLPFGAEAVRALDELAECAAARRDK